MKRLSVCSRSWSGWSARVGSCAGFQSYLVQIPQLARAALLSAGSARAVGRSNFDTQFVVLANLDLYREDVGLTWDDPTFREVEELLFLSLQPDYGASILEDHLHEYYD